MMEDMLPKSVNGRQLPQHVVMCDPSELKLYESIDDVRAKYGQVTIGHLWEHGEEVGYQRCARCRSKRYNIAMASSSAG